ncbi:LysR family transcriptional regulator [Vibrio breoganii]|uniref:LysR family transcriptional regulator n=1 Tax=Vibrio breoganii TaxID=553239 RepID=A0ABX1UG47_9VIBR|nr:LysR family transcriptional regulator [Vibrio breoganii]NMO75199.1 LysR family transcriptional regulator [Vibrio breoganii]NMR71715.1 LysR family transcriptional regulator [Vibrio breoganii]PMF97878.1 LysR family transcriptional regulator [Vibrio breoganii]PMG91271.1 LysR family transcriptional regulator [Vibrio breoganii]PML86541.1 LysR family transcriptional regulator [Vibrio breoganii]
MLITPERLIYMQHVAELGSFSAAGRKLGISASAVAQVIQNMEIDLDVIIFDRVAGKAPTLTAVGRAMYLQALEVVPRLQAMEKKAQSYHAGIEDKLTIAVYGYTFFPSYIDKINRLAEAYPDLTINLVDVEEVADLEVNNPKAADIIIAPQQLKLRHGLESRIVDQLNWQFFVAPSHPLAKIRGELSSHDLLAHKQLLLSENEFATSYLVESMRFSPNVISCSRIYQLASLLLSGIGFAYFPKALLNLSLTHNEVIELQVDFEDEKTSWPIELAWSPSLGPAGLWFVEQFVDL